MATIARLGFKPGWYRGVTTGDSNSFENIVLEPVTPNPAFAPHSTLYSFLITSTGGQDIMFTYWYKGTDESRIAYREGTQFIGDVNSKPGVPRVMTSKNGYVQVRSTQVGQEVLVKVEIL